MPVFWMLFWLGFIGFPLMFLLAGLSQEKGNRVDLSHIWVYKGTKTKARDATVRDVWQRQHPGKSWDKEQGKLYTGCVIFLVIAYLILLIALSGKLFILPTDNTAQRIFWQVGAPVLGGLTMAAFFAIQAFGITTMKTGFFQVLHIIALVIMGLMVLTGLVLGFLKIPLPISHHWIWAVAGFSFLCMLLDPLAVSGSQKRATVRHEAAAKKGGQLEGWVLNVFRIFFVEGYDKNELNLQLAEWTKRKSQGVNFYSSMLSVAIARLQSGELDYLLKDDEFFSETEAIMLDLVSGRQMSIENTDMYGARQDIIRALQLFYFHMVDMTSKRQIHPKIQAALKKHK